MKNILFFSLIIFYSLDAIHAQKSTNLYIRADTLNAKPVSRFIYGNFIELGFGRQIEGLWNQKLYNASFEDIPPFKSPHWGWLSSTPDDDLTTEPWWHTGYEENPWYTYPKEANVIIDYNRYWNFHHGLQAAVLRNPLSEGRIWLAQDGIFLEPDSPTRFMGYFSNNLVVDATLSPVEVTIGIYPEKNFNEPLFEFILTVKDGIWRKFSLDIPALNYSGRITFAISVDSGKTVAYDGFSLMPVNEYRGWRPEVVEALKQINVPMIRFPGGCFASFYNWRHGVGPRIDRRPAKSEYWGGIEGNQVGTAEFIEFCNMIDSEPFICVNMLTGTADEAAAWVEYCNAPSDTPMGALRKQHGYPEPFNVQYWELDNETYRRYGPEQYAAKCVEYSMAMKAVDPDIKLVMVTYWRYNEHLEEMLEIAGPYIDIITNRATGENDLRRDLEILTRYNRENGTSITLSNTEWLVPLNFEETTVDALNFEQPSDHMTLQQHQISWYYAMNAARVLLLFQRLGGDFEFANFNNLANTWGQNIIECAKDKVFISATGRIFELMSHNPADWILRTDQDKDISGLITQAGVSHEGDKLILYILNYNADNKQIRIDPGNWGLSPNGIRLKTVHANGPFSSNTINHPEEIQTTIQTLNLLNRRKPQITILPWSVNEIIFPLTEHGK